MQFYLNDDNNNLMKKMLIKKNFFLHLHIPRENDIEFNLYKLEKKHFNVTEL